MQNLIINGLYYCIFTTKKKFRSKILYLKFVQFYILEHFELDILQDLSKIFYKDGWLVGLCGLMTPGLSKNIRCHVWSYFL